MSDVSGVSSSNMLRITGMATGMDTDSMVKQMMAAENLKLDKLNQNKQVIQWRQDAYRDIIKDLRNLRSNYLLIDSPADSNLIKSQGYTGSNITSSDSTKVTATALPGALNGNSTVEVTQLAKAAKIQGATVNGLTSLSTKLSDLGVTNGSIDITLPSGTVNISVDSTKTVQDLVNTIYNTKTSTGDTLYSKIKINFSELSKNLTFEARETGVNIGGVPNTMSITGNIGMDKLGLDGTATVTNGQDAIVKITPPGAALPTTVTKSSNSFNIDNVVYNLKDVGTTTLTTSADSQKSVDKIKGFVEKYNELVKKITDKLSEKKNYSYKPLTDAQKKEMKDTEITAWEDKAKSGLLKNENDLQSVLNSLRSSFMDGVASAGLTLKDIGIETYPGMEAITKPGQLKIDEAKLKDALENRGDQVMKLFTSTPDSSITDEQIKRDNTGIFKRVEDLINTTSVKFDGSLMKKAGFSGSISEYSNSLTKQLQQQSQSISELSKRLAEKQERYYKMFSKLETAMNKLNSQMASFQSQMGG